jgi:hypothetical protein
MAIRRHTSRSTVSINNRVNSANLALTLSTFPDPTLSYLVVAGGGGGGHGTAGGGGGAGGYWFKSNLFALAPTPLIGFIKGAQYTVVVGGGGAGAGIVPLGGAGQNVNGDNGTNSSFERTGTVPGAAGFLVTATGGGGGAGEGPQIATPGDRKSVV